MLHGCINDLKVCHADTLTHYQNKDNRARLWRCRKMLDAWNQKQTSLQQQPLVVHNLALLEHPVVLDGPWEKPRMYTTRRARVQGFLLGWMALVANAVEMDRSETVCHLSHWRASRKWLQQGCDVKDGPLQTPLSLDVWLRGWMEQ